MSNDNRPNFLSPAALAVLQERRGQVEREGFSAEHDDKHETGELAMAGATYALAGVFSLPKAPWTWPFEKAWWKPKSLRQNLIRAAAFLIAEIERIDRLEAKTASPPVDLEPVSLTYTNWRGETSARSIIPQFVWFGSTAWHLKPQWMLRAFDVEKAAERDFALKDFGSPTPETLALAAQDFMELFVAESGDERTLTVENIDHTELTHRYAALEAALAPAPKVTQNTVELTEDQVAAVLHLVETRLCIVWPRIGAREDFANLLRLLEPMTEDGDDECCVACGETLKAGDMVYYEHGEGGHIHADCCGPERESYCDEDGQPLAPDAPIPQPFAYEREGS